jgi:hypothetical protein
MTIMISPILAKLYQSILEKKIGIWLEIHGKRAKDHVHFRCYPSTVDHLVMLRIVAEERHNNKTNLLCCFVDFRKSFDIVPRISLWNRLEELKVPSEMRVVVVRLYESVISKFRNIEGQSKEINCNIGVNQGCPMSPTLFGIYIDKLEYWLEDAGCTRPTLASIVIILILYANANFLMERNPYDLSKPLRILNEICSCMDMNVNTEKMKVMVIKSESSPMTLLFMRIISWGKFLHTNILELKLITSSIGTIVLIKG